MTNQGGVALHALCESWWNALISRMIPRVDSQIDSKAYLAIRTLTTIGIFSFDIYKSKWNSSECKLYWNFSSSPVGPFVGVWACLVVSQQGTVTAMFFQVTALSASLLYLATAQTPPGFSPETNVNLAVNFPTPADIDITPGLLVPQPGMHRVSCQTSKSKPNPCQIPSLHQG